MPIYEYQATDVGKSCERCASPFEVLQSLGDDPLAECPICGNPVIKIISWCRAAIVEANPDEARVAGTVADYERAGMYSHAAELADSHSEKTGDASLKSRALDNYKKAGYDVDRLAKSDSS